MYLQERLEDVNRISHPMAGVIRAESAGRNRLERFGYVTVEAAVDGRYLKQGETIRGHEFHYWDSSDNGDTCLAVKPDGRRLWPCIHMKGTLFAGYPHLYYPSCPEFAVRFADACRAYRQKTDKS